MTQLLNNPLYEAKRDHPSDRIVQVSEIMTTKMPRGARPTPRSELASSEPYRAQGNAKIFVPSGEFPTPNHELADASPYWAAAAAPESFIVWPIGIDLWGNEEARNSSWAEEAFAKACGEPLVGYYPEHAPGFADAISHELPSDTWATCETCEVADMLVLGLKLTIAGVGDHWEDIDRCLRNQFVENQITKTDWVDRIPADTDASSYRSEDQPLQLWEDETDVVERAVGSWAGWATANDGVSTK